jgi:hypothetical protein
MAWWFGSISRTIRAWIVPVGHLLRCLGRNNRTRLGQQSAELAFFSSRHHQRLGAYESQVSVSTLIAIRFGSVRLGRAVQILCRLAFKLPS